MSSEEDGREEKDYSQSQFDEQEDSDTIKDSMVSQAVSEKSSNRMASLAASQQGRQFGCPCGKFYLSSAALYTHVKFKHNGIPPGALIKPQRRPYRFRSQKGREDRMKTIAETRGKFRGKTRWQMEKTPVFANQIEEDSDCPFDLPEEARKLMMNMKVTVDRKYQASTGDVTCQDMASKFLEELSILEEEEIKIVKYFLCELRIFINSVKGPNYWQQQKPDDIVLCMNDFCKSYNVSAGRARELSKDSIIDLVYLLCKWMYKKKWTNSKLIKRMPPHVIIPRREKPENGRE